MKHKSERQLSLKSLWLLLIMVSFVLALLLPGIAGAATTKTFTNTVDVTLESRYRNRNYGEDQTCYVDGRRGSGGERSTLMSWRISTLPSDSRITKATIYLRVKDPSKDTFYVYGLKKKWYEDEANWLQANDDLDWRSAGANSSYDRNTDKSGTLYARKVGTAKIELDPDLIEDWLGDPYENYGVIIAGRNRSSSDRISFYCSDVSQSTKRPKLVIEYR